MTTTGAILPIYKAASIAVAVRPVSGDVPAMLTAVEKMYHGDKMAALFVQHHQQYAA